jgi:hypothetical protein
MRMQRRRKVIKEGRKGEVDDGNQGFQHKVFYKGGRGEGVL